MTADANEITVILSDGPKRIADMTRDELVEVVLLLAKITEPSAAQHKATLEKWHKIAARRAMLKM